MSMILDGYDPSEKLEQVNDKMSKHINEMIMNDMKETNDEDEIVSLVSLLNSMKNGNNTFYLQKMALTSIIKSLLPGSVKKVSISDISERDYDYEEVVYERIQVLIDAVYVLFMAKRAQGIKYQAPDQELVSYLKSKKFPDEFNDETLVDFEKLLIRVLSKREFQNQFIKDEIAIYIIQCIAYGSNDIEFAKSFGGKLGIVDNQHLIHILKSIRETYEYIHAPVEVAMNALLDKEELFKKYENGTISDDEKDILRPGDYIFRFLQNFYLGKPNSPDMLEKIKINTLMNMFTSGIITVDDLCVLLTDSSSRFSKCNSKDKDRLKNSIKKLLPKINRNPDIIEESEEQDKETRICLRNSEILQLAQLGYVSNEYVLQLYAKQENDKKITKQQNKSEQLYEEKEPLSDNGVISAKEMLRFFDEKKLIDYYFRLRNSNKIERFNIILDYCILYISPSIISFQLLKDERTTTQDIIFFSEKGIVSDEKIKTLILNNSEFKTDFFNHIRQIESQPDDKPEKEPSYKIFEYFNRAIINEDDLIEIFNDRYEVILRDAFRKRYIRLDKLKELTFLDNSIVMEEYNNSLNNHLKSPETEEQEQDLKSMLDIYLLTDDLVNFEDIYKIVEERKDHILQDESFDPIKYIYDTIVNDVTPAIEESPIFDRNILISKIRELYMNSFLRLDELNMLVDQDIIERENAKKIDDDFNNSEIIKKIESSKLGDSAAPVQTLNPNPTPRSTSSGRKEPKPPTDKQILQADAMIKFLSSIGFEPKTTTNAFGIEQMDTFDSGDFKDYRIFLSKENLRVVIMVHLKQLPNTDMYYHVGDNATYLMSSSSFLAYLRSSGFLNSALSSFNTTKSNARGSKFTKTANVGKFWGRTVPRKICEIMSELDNPELLKMKNANFEIMSIFPESLMAQDQKARLEQINKCLEELNAVREMNDD